MLHELMQAKCIIALRCYYMLVCLACFHRTSLASMQEVEVHLNSGYETTKVCVLIVLATRAANT